MCSSLRPGVNLFAQPKTRRTLRLSSQPTPKHNQFVGHKDRAEDRFVMPGKPVGQIDVEVVRSFIRELGCHICQWTPASIQGEYATLNNDQHGQDQSPVESAQHACDGQQDNASGESRPNHSGQELIAVNIEILAVSDPVSTWSGASALREFLPPLGASGPRRSRQSCRAARTN